MQVVMKGEIAAETNTTSVYRIYQFTRRKLNGLMQIVKSFVSQNTRNKQRKDQFKNQKFNLNMKVTLPNNNNKIYTLRRLGYSESDCKKALKLSKNDLSSAIYWLFTFYGNDKKRSP